LNALGTYFGHLCRQKKLELTSSSFKSTANYFRICLRQ
jgi:hypothetical protein